MPTLSLSRTDIAAALVGLAVAAPALAAGPATLDFEGVTSFAPVAAYYAGGTDGAGHGGGANLGVTFSGPVLALSNDALGPYFSHAPSPGTVMFSSDAGAWLDVATALTGSVSFWYSASAAFGNALTVWSGLDGTGTRLGTFAVTANAQSDGCSDSAFCHWTQATLAFAGQARSIGFGGDPGAIAFDNLAVTIAPVPEPSTVALLGLGLVGLVLQARRRRA